MDSGCPSIGDICNYLWFLFKNKDTGLSSIERYRTATADTYGNATMDISNNIEIFIFGASFHRDKHPFEPLEEASIIILMILAS